MHRPDDNETIIGLVAEDLGAALVPRLMLDDARTDIARLELATAPPPRKIALTWHRDRNEEHVRDDLVRFAREACTSVR